MTADWVKNRSKSLSPPQSRQQSHRRCLDIPEGAGSIKKDRPAKGGEKLMNSYQPFSVIGFHSCERELGLEVLNAKAVLKPSRNTWDWLADGIYFWEQDPLRPLQSAGESASGIQFNRKAITVPFVLGAIIDLGNCLNLLESSSLELLTKAYKGLQADPKNLISPSARRTHLIRFDAGR